MLIASVAALTRAEICSAKLPRTSSCMLCMTAGPRKAGWLPGAIAPSYLDGSQAGDVGFDPLCLVALARTRTSVDSGPWSRMDREARMLMATAYERHKKVAWMREAELKHS